jgi:hypothetical protein
MPTSKNAAEPPVWTPADTPILDPAPATGEAAPTTSDGTAGRQRRSGAVTGLLAIIALAATAGIAFAAGRATAPETAANTVNDTNGDLPAQFNVDASIRPDQLGLPNNQPGDGQGLGASIRGEVTAISADSITIELASGETVTVATASTTTYHARQVVTSADVSTGDTVVVNLVRLGPNAGNRAGLGQQGRTAADITVVAQ